MTRLRRVLVIGGSALALAALYLLAWPVPVRPVAWSPPAAPRLEGALAPNARLAAVEWIARAEILGPEAVAIDAAGVIHTGTVDGRIVRFPALPGPPEEVARTGGRPLGMCFDAEGNLVVADAYRGLLSIARDGAVRTLAAGHEGEPFRFADDVDIDRADGTIYFTDASRRFGLDAYEHDIIEHSGTGRLLAYRPVTGRTEVLVDGLQFANGVALGPEGAYAVVCETGSYRLVRRWLRGPRAGTTEPFVEDLPGFPDNVTYSPARRAFWVAIASPRERILDALGPHPFLRTVVTRLPRALRPRARRHARVLAVDLDGRIVANLEDAAPTSYAPLTSAREHEGWLYFGSFVREGLARIAAPP